MIISLIIALGNRANYNEERNRMEHRRELLKEIYQDYKNITSIKDTNEFQVLLMNKYERTCDSLDKMK